ncbi:hypothetical protein [Kingella sp. (in: b-proteobacteria)]|uniref:hypothetical protein n=1 Tax=Kingella sp. (in: b-proteobacteria) TaxID=2020713 RepID=UPI0026DD9790|nr:hypothetical protein [Kingella sp. (in: b-proteobacteria)]MDO4657501.1 hypothetical protein [Kingella sp. (in: b-proteobacteria)]
MGLSWGYWEKGSLKTGLDAVLASLKLASLVFRLPLSIKPASLPLNQILAIQPMQSRKNQA